MIPATRTVAARVLTTPTSASGRGYLYANGKRQAPVVDTIAPADTTGDAAAAPAGDVPVAKTDVAVPETTIVNPDADVAAAANAPVAASAMAY